MDRPRDPLGWRLALPVFVLALIPRLAHWWYVRATPLAGEFVPDLSAYLYAASRLMDSAYFFAEPMYMSPGYALILAPQYILAGPDVPLFVLVNAVLDAGSAVLCAGLAARLVPAGRARAAGLTAGGLYALCGPLVFYALLPLGEGPAIFCLLLALTLLFRAPEGLPEKGGLAAWLAGALFALAALIRPNLAPAAPLLLAAWCLVPGAAPRPARSLRFRAAGRFCLGLALVLLPFMAHNLAVSGRATPFGFQGGVTLYSGNQPGASGVGDGLPGLSNTPYLVVIEAWAEAARRSGQDLTLAGADAYWYAEAWRFFSQRPGEAARLLGKKALLLVNPGGLDATANLDFCARFSPVPGLLALPLGLIFALAAAGLWWTARPSRPSGDTPPEPTVLALAVALATLAALVVLFQVTPRYRAPLLPLAICFAAAALVAIPDLLRGPRVKSVGPAVSFALVLGLSFIPLRTLVEKPGFAAQEHARLARYYLLKGPQALAPAEFVAALALGAPDPEGLKAGLAASLYLSGRIPPKPAP